MNSILAAVDVYDSCRRLAILCTITHMIHYCKKIPARVFYINTNVHTSSLNADVHVQADKVSQDKVQCFRRERYSVPIWHAKR